MVMLVSRGGRGRRTKTKKWVIGGRDENVSKRGIRGEVKILIYDILDHCGCPLMFSM